ncbi:putative penicillin-binding protein [Aspergillus campestris IBT 28561]|uniref:Unguisins hydrolase ungD' n=1 Tax=Aspergillus campestris (strain IBT 28561) TaxID=1392248 RepID=UNGD_ASPC2|nr:putative penicillin-binding protein [Aspergillus campestris IBT 28561]A0A2I1D2N1.1 RecName: Full=Unguisins hydrolase ungD'; AltName: Full=Unguisins biosynthesis cluster protein D' [Aspergillus campestris IBT 28561]PKY04127.1 putative penicillin-binding protein [Aspergillus campestris IBT 28561]
MISKTEDSGDPLDQDFAEVVKQTLDRWHIPGMSVAVVDGPDTWTKGYGLAQLPNTNVTPDTLFYTGSTTKAFTAAVLSLLVDDNKNYPQVQWNTPVNQLLRDDFVLSHEWDTNNITIEDILSHRTGMPRHEFAFGGDYDGHPASLRDIVRSVRYMQRSAPPRTTYQYSNLMFIVASYLIETLTGKWIGDVFREKIWRPLGMDSTYLSLEDARASGKELAQGYLYNSSLPGYEPVPLKNKPEVSGAGAAISNIKDYAKWATALLKRAPDVLSPAGYSAIWSARTVTPTHDPFITPSAYALAWNTQVYQGVEIVWHDGGIDGFGTEIALIPSLGFAVVTQANTTYSSNYAGTALVYHLIDKKLDVAPDKRFDWNKWYEDLERQMKEAVKNARQTFYPTVPSPAPPPTLPIGKYTGNYWHPAYRQLTILWDEERNLLYADRKDSTTPCQLTFIPVSREFFLVRLTVVGAEAMLPAEFRLGPDGTPSMVGILWEPSLGDEKIWLKKEGDTHFKEMYGGIVDSTAGKKRVPDTIHPIDL